MIKCNLSKLMGIHKMTIKDVHEKTKLTRITISGLYHETVKRADFETIERLCELFNVQPGELLEWVREESD